MVLSNWSQSFVSVATGGMPPEQGQPSVEVNFYEEQLNRLKLKRRKMLVKCTGFGRGKLLVNLL
jgi:hypothetical protein